ncbi:energy-coupling factor transporter transmembrane component T [Paenibacillus humicus]|uniref:energy-coupling factor transporter transmembrane component T n=1 Tax=Paenibacillus humicus TaxID=412861 RepID=UPI0013E299F6|nr:energy-coupling factor transporter transmembrane component T [Paenibacillus humicus]
MSRGLGFNGLHPAVAMLYFLVLLVSCMMFTDPVMSGLTLLALVALHLSLDGGRTMRRGLKLYAVLALFIFITNPLFSSRGATILFYFRDRPVTQESVVYGALFALSLVNVLLAFAAYSLVITSDKFLLLAAPIAPQTAFAITVTLRFIPLLTRRLKQIMTVQRAFGYIYPGMRKKLLMREGMETMHTLVAWSLEESMQSAASMRSRGYGSGKRSSAVRYRMEARDWACLWLIVLLGSQIVIGRLYGVHDYEVFPRLQPLDVSLSAWVHLGCYAVFLAIPPVMNGKERLHWRIIRSRM